MTALTVGEADQWLTAVTDTLKQEDDDGGNIADRRIAGDGRRTAYQGRAFIDQDQRDIR